MPRSTISGGPPDSLRPVDHHVSWFRWHSGERGVAPRGGGGDDLRWPGCSGLCGSHHANLSFFHRLADGYLPNYVGVIQATPRAEKHLTVSSTEGGPGTLVRGLATRPVLGQWPACSRPQRSSVVVGQLRVSCPYSAEFVQGSKQLGGRWDGPTDAVLEVRDVRLPLAIRLAQEPGVLVIEQITMRDALIAHRARLVTS